MEFAPGRWHASWVWSADQPASRGRWVVLLRRDLHVEQVPLTVPTRLVAASRYVLVVNGAEVARGPVRANPRRKLYDVLDLAPHLVPGANALAVMAWCYQQPMPWWHPLPGTKNDLARGAFAMEARLGDDWLVTDETWQAAPVPEWEL